MSRWGAGVASVLASLAVGALALWWLRSPGAGSDRDPIHPPDPPATSAPRAAGPPNLVLIIGCTLRRDQLSPYNAPAEITPFLDRIAADGTRFLHGVAAAPWTRAAATAIVTGHHAIEVGIIEPEPRANRRRLAPEVVTLAERLRDAGYETIGLTANPNLNRTFGFDQGFDSYFEAQDLWIGGRVTKIPAGQMAAEALARVDDRARPGAPLYLRILTLDTHAPIEVGPRRSRKLQMGGVPPRVGAYRVEVQRWDLGIEALWRGLSLRGYDATNTVLVVVSDHGEGLSWPPEHGVGHGNFLLPSALDMPWVVHGVGVATDHRVGGMASQIDLHPTLLGLASIGGYDGEGRDLSDAIRGRSDHTGSDRAYSDTWFMRASRAAIYTEDRICLHDFLDLAERRGIPRIMPRTACFDRSTDRIARFPMDTVDQALVADLHAWREGMWARFEAWPHHSEITATDPVMDQLRQLGYAD